MNRLEELRAQVHTLVDETTSEEDLQLAVESLQRTHEWYFTDEQEREIALARQEVKEGKFVTLEEFKRLSKARVNALIETASENDGNRIG
jgi:hypothetical protein